MQSTRAHLTRFGILLTLAATTACGITVVSGGGQDPTVEVPVGTGGSTSASAVGGQAAVGGATSVGGQAGTGGTPTPLEVTGACIVRDEHADLPAFDAPDVGPGYAKRAIPGVDDMDGLHLACTPAIYAALLAQHCALSPTSVQQEFVTYAPDGQWTMTGCAAWGCDFIYCP
jgi:hypothetical protein